MLKPYFKNGIFSEKIDAITPGFIGALTIGLVRYMGDARTDELGMERPLAVAFSVKKSENSQMIYDFFKSTFDLAGLDYKNLGEKSREDLKTTFFDDGFDCGIMIYDKNDEIKLEIFERGDDIGGLEASLPGGVNFEGKVKSVNHALPIPQIVVNQIEHALNTEFGFGF